jgi:ribonuclease P protein component
MLPRKYRLVKKKDFKNLHKKGDILFSKNFVLKFKKNNLRQTRFAFVVSFKVSKKAVVRNKLKRRLREIIRAYLPKIKKGYDILIIAKSSSLDLNFKQLKIKILLVLGKAGLVDY